jgi:hypothetical protein
VTAQRPRDRLGRPLPTDADPALIVPGIGPIDALDDGQVWALAVSYLDNGMPFHAHEVFEARWRTAPPMDRDAWQAHAQWAAALTHTARGNDVGAQRLTQRARDLMRTAPSIPACMDGHIMDR